MFNLKDAAAKAALGVALRKYVTRMIEFKLDPTRRQIKVAAELKGEDKPIAVEIDGYDYGIEADGVWFVVNQISISREWMHLAAQQAIGRRFFIPGQQQVTILKLLKGLGVI